MDDRLCRPTPAIHLRVEIDLDMKWYRFRARQPPPGFVQGNVIAHYDAGPEDGGIERDVGPISTHQHDVGKHEGVLLLRTQDANGEDGCQKFAR